MNQHLYTASKKKGLPPPVHGHLLVDISRTTPQEGRARPVAIFFCIVVNSKRNVDNKGKVTVTFLFIISFFFPWSVSLNAENTVIQSL